MAFLLTFSFLSFKHSIKILGIPSYDNSFSITVACRIKIPIIEQTLIFKNLFNFKKNLIFLLFKIKNFK